MEKLEVIRLASLIYTTLSPLTTSSSPQPLNGHRVRDYALRPGARLERQDQRGGRVSEGDQQDGQGNHRGGKRPDARQGAPGPQTNEVHPEPTLYARPRGGDGPEEILASERAASPRASGRRPPHAPGRPSRRRSGAPADFFPAKLSSRRGREPTRPHTSGGAGTQCGPTAHAWTMER